jgi:type I restriction enzyme S subunit
MSKQNKNIPPGFKPSPLGPIPKDWEVKRLGDFFEFKNGLNKEKEAFGTGIPIVNYTDVYKNGSIHAADLKGRVTLNASEIKRYQVKKGDVFFTRTSETIDEIGLSSVILDDVKDTVFSGFILRAHPINGKISINYRKYCFSTYNARKEIIRKSTYTTRALTNGTFLSEVLLFIPPVFEQEALADCINNWDVAIQKIAALISQKEQRKKWLMQMLLNGKKRLKGFKGEWKEYRLDDFFTERNETRYFDLPLLSVGANGIYPQSDSIKKDTSNEDKSKYRRICPGDIGYNTMRMWQGRSALSLLEGIVSPAYTIVTPKKNADSIFFSYLFKYPKTVHAFFRKSQGLVEDTLNCKFHDFATVKVILPPTKEEQTTIANVLQAADKEIQLLNQKLKKLKEQKKGLMQVLLTGKKRLKVNL